MSKSFKILLLVALLAITLIGCSKYSDNAITTAENFKETQFNVEMYKYENGITPEIMAEVKTKLSPFQTKDFLEQQTKNRILTLPLLVAWKQKSTLSLKNLSFKTISENKEKQEVNLSYTATLTLNNNSKNIDLDGVINLIQTDGSWKVTYDNFNTTDLFNLTVGN